MNSATIPAATEIKTALVKLLRVRLIFTLEVCPKHQSQSLRRTIYYYFFRKSGHKADKIKIWIEKQKTDRYKKEALVFGTSEIMIALRAAVCLVRTDNFYFFEIEIPLRAPVQASKLLRILSEPAGAGFRRHTGKYLKKKPITRISFSFKIWYQWPDTVPSI